MEKVRIEQYYDKYISSLLKGDWSNCSAIVNDFLTEEYNIITCYEEVIKAAMYEVGRLWETNKISVATEHMASTISESIINKVFYDIRALEKSNRKVVLSCVENEQHLIGLKMVADIFERYGWNTIILVANTPVRDLVNYVRVNNPDLIALSVTLYFNIPVLDNMLDVINKELPYTQIIVGGQAFTRGGFELILNHKNVKFLPDLIAIEDFLKHKR